MGDLQKVPGIGEKKEKLLTELGYASLSELKEADADELYLRACVKEGWKLDKCVLYAFRCAGQQPLPLVVFYGQGRCSKEMIYHRS